MALFNLSQLLQRTSAPVLNVLAGFEMMASQIKQVKVMKRIGTHSGVFHCDEALACFMLKQLPEYKDAEIVRTRDENLLQTCDIVVDVGGVYNPETLRFDHHQRSFEHTLSTIRPQIAKNKNIKLSSAGLIYAHYGLDVISEILKRTTDTSSFLNDESLTAIYIQIYETFVEEMDAIDNGIPMYDGLPRYKISTHLSARVHRLNPEWNAVEDDKSADKLFKEAMGLVGSELTDRIVEFQSSTIWWPARDIVRKAINDRMKFHPSGAIIALEERCPWKEHLFALEDELGIEGELKFVIFHDKSDQWRVQGIPLQSDSFICRVFLHKDWWGVRDEELSDVSGIPHCIFCHATGFIGGNAKKAGAIAMAEKSLVAANI